MRYVLAPIILVLLFLLVVLVVPVLLVVLVVLVLPVLVVPVPDKNEKDGDDYPPFPPPPCLIRIGGSSDSCCCRYSSCFSLLLSFCWTHLNSSSSNLLCHYYHSPFSSIILPSLFHPLVSLYKGSNSYNIKETSTSYYYYIYPYLYHYPSILYSNHHYLYSIFIYYYL